MALRNTITYPHSEYPPVIVGALLISLWDYHLCANGNDYDSGALMVDSGSSFGADDSSSVIVVVGFYGV